VNGSTARTGLAAAALLALAACARDAPVAPAPLPTPSPTPPTELHAVSVFVFYDENGNGRRDRDEDVRVPNVGVAIAGRTAVTDRAQGRAFVTGVPAGPQQVVIAPAAAPPFFVPGPPLAIVVPTPGDVRMPMTLPIGRNRRNVYMAAGDSITVGDGSSDGSGYLGPLESQLARHFGRALAVNRGVSATDTREGLRLIRDQLRAVRPAYTLIHYGTNDWLHCAGQVPCYTVDNLRRMVEAVKGGQGLPCLATIIPANPKLNPEGRNNWVGNIDRLIRELATAEGALLVDLESAFRREPDLSQLFSDHVHPNDRGYRVMADEFFRAITQRRSSQAFDVGFDPPWASW